MAPAQRYQVYGLDETYPQLGKFSFKIVLNPKFFKSGQDFDVQLLDSARNTMKFKLQKWGRKLNIDFVIDDSVPDGVSTAFINKDNVEIGRLLFWIIKP